MIGANSRPGELGEEAREVGAGQVAWGQHVVLMDEPIAALGVRQLEFVLELIHTLADRRVAAVLISHNMQRVLDVCHEVLVLRHRRNVGNFPIGDVVVPDLVSLVTTGTTS